MSISSVGSGNSAAVTTANNSQSQTLQTLLGSIDSQPSLLNVLADSSTGGSGSSGDLLDLSSAGQTAADQLEQLLESSMLGIFQTSANDASAAVQKQLSAALAQNGIDTSQKIDLQVDSSGNVVVSNNNSQSQQIEATINDNPALKAAVTEYVQFMQSIAPILENSGSTQSALSSDLGLTGSLGSGTQGAVTLALQGNGFTTSYQDGSNNSVVLASSQS